jgi:hypothetical protein
MANNEKEQLVLIELVQSRTQATTAASGWISKEALNSSR